MSQRPDSADGGAMPAEVHKTRRGLLTALASVPALAVMPAMAVASPTSTDRLTDLIAVHDAALVAIQTADKALDELTDPDVSVSFLGHKLEARGGVRHATREADARYGA